MNKATGDKATVKANQPEQQQHYKNSPEHESYLLVSNVLVTLNQANRDVCALDHIPTIVLKTTSGTSKAARL